jgi:hypothetical protein
VREQRAGAAHGALPNEHQEAPYWHIIFEILMRLIIYKEQRISPTC